VKEVHTSREPSSDQKCLSVVSHNTHIIMCRQHTSCNLPQHTCHHMSSTHIANTCLQHNTCHQHVSSTHVINTCHQHMSSTLVTNTVLIFSHLSPGVSSVFFRIQCRLRQYPRSEGKVVGESPGESMDVGEVPEYEWWIS
jgi:hypothetical protein